MRLVWRRAVARGFAWTVPEVRRNVPEVRDGAVSPPEPLVRFFVAGVPVPKGSMRAFRLPSSARIVMTHANARTKPWQSAVAVAAAEARAAREGLTMHGELAGPLIVRLVFNMPRPRSHYGSGKNAATVKKGAPVRPSGKPDIDKLARLVLDACTSVLWRDDCQVVDLRASKQWAAGQPGVHVEVEEAGA